MTAGLEVAINELRNGDFTLVTVKDGKILRSHERGVRPLIALLDGKTGLNGASAADKVVGKAAAMLYVLLGVKEIYASVVSEGAKEILASNGIALYYDECVKAIINRNGTGFCPMEEAVGDERNPDAALVMIRKKLKELALGNNA